MEKKINKNEIPALKILILVLFGFIIGSFFYWNYLLLIIVFIISISLFFLLLKYKYNAIAFVIVSIAIGVILSSQSYKDLIKSPNKITQEFSANFSGRITEIISKKDNHLRCIAIGSFDAKFLDNINNNRVLLTISGLNKTKNQLIPGAWIRTSVYARVPESPVLSTDFPEDLYTAAINVQWIARANEKNLSIIKPANYFEILYNDFELNIKNHLNSLFRTEYYGLVLSLLLGDKTQLATETQTEFSMSGTAHVLAVSGLNVGIIAFFIFVILGFIKNKWIKFIVFSFIVLFYIIITHFQASAIRAGLMSIAFLLAYTTEKKSNPLNIISFIVLWIILLYPNYMYSIGLQMSVLSVYGIIILYNPIKDFFSKIFKNKNQINKYIRDSLSLTFSASIVVSPIVAYYFHIFSIISPIANFFIVPLMSLVMIFSSIALILSYIYFPLASIYASATELCLYLSNLINKQLISFSYSYVIADNLYILAFVISVLLIYMFLSKHLKIFVFRACISVVFLILIIELIPNTDLKTIAIYPRNHTVSVFIPSNNNEYLVIVSDRKPNQYPIRDIALENYILKLKGKITIAINGNSGIGLTDELKKKINFKIYDLPVEYLEKLRIILRINNEIPQLIENKKYEIRN